MLRNLLLNVIFVFVFAASGLAVNAQGEVPISGSIGNGRVQRGKAAVVTIVMDIPGGLHVNSNRPGVANLRPTRVNVTAPGLKIGAVNYPRGLTRKLSFSEQQINIYEGRAVFRFNVTVPATFKGNAAKVRAVVDYQSCTDEVCYRPRSQDITLSAAVR